MTQKKRSRTATIPCPACGSHQNSVLDVRYADEGYVRRRRSCQCGYRFTTYEMLADSIRHVPDYQI